MKKFSHGLIAVATAAAIATAGTTTAAAQTSASRDWDPIKVTVGEIPDYAGMSSDASNTSSNQRQTAVGVASNTTGASGDDVNVALGIGATVLVLVTGAALYLGAAQAGIVPGVSMQLPGINWDALPSIPNLPRF